MDGDINEVRSGALFFLKHYLINSILQAFFAAQYLAESIEDGDEKYWEFIREHIGEEKNEYVWYFLVGRWSDNFRGNAIHFKKIFDIMLNQIPEGARKATFLLNCWMETSCTSELPDIFFNYLYENIKKYFFNPATTQCDKEKLLRELSQWSFCIPKINVKDESNFDQLSYKKLAYFLQQITGNHTIKEYVDAVFLEAARLNKTNFIKRTFSLHPNINAKNELGETAFHMAAQRKDYNMCVFLLENGIDLNIKNNAGVNAVDASGGDVYLLAAIDALRERNTPQKLSLKESSTRPLMLDIFPKSSTETEKNNPNELVLSNSYPQPK